MKIVMNLWLKCCFCEFKDAIFEVEQKSSSQHFSFAPNLSYQSETGTR